MQQRGEAVGLLHGQAQTSPAAHIVFHLLQVPRQLGIAHDFPGHPQGADQRNASLEQRAQCASKYRAILVQQQGAQHGHAQQEGMLLQLALRVGIQPLPPEPDADEKQDHQIRITLNALTERQQKRGRRRNLGAGIFKHDGELRHHEGQQQKHGDDAGHQQHHGVDHGRQNRRAVTAAGFQKIHQIGQQLMQNAALFAGAYDVDVHPREHIGSRLHGLGQALAFLHVAAQRDHQLAHGRRFGDAFQQAERLVQRHPRLDQRAQAGGEVQQVHPFDLAAPAAFALVLFRARDLYGNQFLALQNLQRLALGLGIDLPCLHIALGVVGLIAIIASTHMARVTLTTSSGVVRPAASFSRAS